MGQYSIKDVESLSGIKAHTLRMWEQRYDFLKPSRTDTNIRYYSDEQLRLILNVGTLNRNGMRISKIAGLPHDQICKEVERISGQGTGTNELLDGLIHSMLDFDEARFEKTLACAIMKHGFERAFSEIVSPMLNRTGVLWATGTIHPAQEHFISNLIRRKLCAAIDNQYVAKTQNSRRFVLFLPEGETHELILLFTEYILRAKNHHVAYIGNSVPFSDIDFIQNSFKPDYFVIYFTIAPVEMSLNDYLNQIETSFPNQKFMVGGKQIETQKPKIPHNVCVITSTEEMLKAIN
jgi:MerR family transcriptional regulator, light-induced transcriptional regulator